MAAAPTPIVTLRSTGWAWTCPVCSGYNVEFEPHPNVQCALCSRRFSAEMEAQP